MVLHTLQGSIMQVLVSLALSATAAKSGTCQAPKAGHNVLLQVAATANVQSSAGPTAGQTSGPSILATCPATEPGISKGNVQTSQVNECSGLAASRTNPGKYWVNNDSGAGPTLYAIDAYGKHWARLRVNGGANDWEDVAAGPGPEEGKDYIYIADTGDNSRHRGHVEIYRIEDPEIPAGRDRNNDIWVDVQKFEITYPDGAHDCEAMFIDQGPAAQAQGTAGRVYLIIKGEANNQDRRWKGGEVFWVDLPKYSASGLQFHDTGVSIPVDWVTGADITTDGSLIAVRNYGEVLMWPRAHGTPVENNLAIEGVCRVDKKDEQQGEAIAFGVQNDHYITVSEGKYPPVWYFDLSTEFHQAMISRLSDGSSSHARIETA
eukprot:TRINITY_DN1567_c0_g1_i1.p1 TRINITY_DN1567_c0_g1~~TRINITY_DN1567_c0_g1_i1.p1  ORF type:complete len:376 (-),score=83.20 TRINITY_DN1567_c0_g1_i1:78-1205(-)